MVDGRCHRCGVLGAHALEADCIWSLSQRIDKIERSKRDLVGGAADWLPPRPGVQRGAKPDAPPPAEPRRVESGPVRIGDDWPGVFIRGAEALALAARLRKTSEGVWSVVASWPEQLLDLVELLESWDAERAKPVRLQLAEPLPPNDSDGD